MALDFESGILAEQALAFPGATVYASDPAFDGPNNTKEQRIAAANAFAKANGKTFVKIPLSMAGYNVALCPPSAGVQYVNEGGSAGALAKTGTISTAGYARGTSGNAANDNAVAVNAAIAAAPGLGATMVEVVTAHLPYNASLVTFNPAVQMIREGGPPFYYDVLAYGAVGDGVTDDTAAINAAEVNRVSGSTLYFAGGKTFLVGVSYSGGTGAGNANKFLRMTQPGVWKIVGATIKYGGAAAFVGSDGGTYGVVNVLTDNSRIEGDGSFTIDCNNLAAVGIAYKSQSTGHDFFVRLVNKTEVANSNWPGISGSCSADITGVAISGRAKNIAGILKRPSCPMISVTGGAITAHSDITAYVLGGSFQLGNMTGCAITMNDTFDVCLQKLDTLGILRFPQQNARNENLWDLVINDVGCSNIELYGAMGCSPQRLTWGASITIDVQTSQDMFITATSNIAATLLAPSNLPNASDRTWRIRLIFFNNSGGALTTPIAFTGGAGGYKSSGSVGPGNGQRIVVEFTYDQVNNLWIETYRGAAV